MFALEQPSIALNDTRLDVVVNMAITKTVKPGEGISQVLKYIVDAAKSAPGGKLKNAVFNCHGEPGRMAMGVGIDRTLTNRFAQLAPDGKPLVETIYLRSCTVARIDGAGQWNDGNLFCCGIAKNAKCMVVASTTFQETGYKNSRVGPLPYGMLDKFEGTTLVYGPEGNVLKTTTNPVWTRLSFDNE